MNALRPCLGLLAALLLASPLQADTFVLDKARSRIAVGAKATTHAFTGVLKDFEVKITGVRKSLEPTAVELKWDFKDLDTDEPKRNANMLNWLDHAKTPGGSFKMTKWIRDAKGQTFARGDIIIHGVKKQITFPCKVARNGNTIVTMGTARLDYTDFGLPIIRQLAILTVKPELNISFKLVGTSK
ncbi:MAG: YceI family protein [Verrucomicrobia bacterium]|nr:YceI family protein [Verrucomicrobiota bacterium]